MLQEISTTGTSASHSYRCGDHPGDRSHRGADPDLMHTRAQHRDFLDTHLIVDHQLKHGVSTLHAADPKLATTRDLLAFLTRRPVGKDHHPFGRDAGGEQPQAPAADGRTVVGAGQDEPGGEQPLPGRGEARGGRATTPRDRDSDSEIASGCPWRVFPSA